MQIPPQSTDVSRVCESWTPLLHKIRVGDGDGASEGLIVGDALGAGDGLWDGLLVGASVASEGD